MTLKVLLAVVAVLLIGYMLVSRRGDVGVPDAKRLVQGGARLVDVRSPEEFAAGHIEGAVNIPVHELSGRMAELEPKDRAVVVYCASGARSARAASDLRAAGFASVHNLGAMSRW
jgi:rhodanese-related sulfurtransferase